MKRKGKIWLFLIAILIFVLGYTTLAGVSSQYGDTETQYIKSVSDIRFGIDIRGGVEVTFSPVESTADEEEEDNTAEGSLGNITPEQLDSAVAVMETRLASLGITDYELYKESANNRIILRFPWQADETNFDAEAAIDELGATAMLTFREGYEYDETTGAPAGTTAENIILQGSDVKSATANYGQTNGGSYEYYVTLELNDEGAAKFAEATERLAAESGSISIWMDNTIISAPTVNDTITGGTAIITGSFDAESAQSLADTINAGSLPFAMAAESYSTISASLGSQALQAMVIAGIIAFLLVCVFMIINYRLPGIVACITLLGQIAGTLAFVSGYFVVFNSFTLTLPGIAGIILAIGMGVDANIIATERIREELRSGKKLDAAVKSAYKRALAPVVDGNITVLIVAIILIGAFGPTDTIFAKLLYPVFFAFGASTTGAIYSFGYTLLIGVLLNFVFGVVCTRVMVTSATKFRALRNPVFYGGIKPGAEVPAPSNIGFVKNRKRAFAFSGVLMVIILALSIIPFFRPTLDVEFKGGAIITYSYTGEVDTAEVETGLAESLGAAITMQEGYDSYTGSKLLTVTVAGGQGIAKDTLNDAMAALQEKYPDNNFDQLEVNNVSASMGREFLLKCVVAVVVASLLILAYIAYRFRKIGGWVGGLTAIVALLHDLAIVYGAFVVLRIPLNGNFIAALLVILGYSINGSVVIYDRVRENRGLYGKRMDFGELVNLSINQSMARSVKTTITTVTALACVCIFALVYGLDSIFSFAFPMMLGLVSGAYSSLCVAGPLWVKLASKKKK